VKLDVPIWINAADRLQSVAVVVTRIEKHYVQGYLSEPSRRRPVTTPKIVVSARRPPRPYSATIKSS
jgi:hypothetical protein